ncbi:helix-turn-helix domain-containing protein [Gulosibacter molinativorax]|uniref:Transcriptional regulator n=1 Tax=Gulosibacter molinativorax TaxID=256821 RepID=A0ABT7C919_9MICO|nr:helix-turn-helix transcriptional regulator [Gulosibacter molinativorax]MDJ1371608.1 transcriptional regulator [Gulosibacter molinativorax]QUY61049.1 Transcriptional regulator ClgR [Gulosibacter molinativorax]
MVLVRHEMGEVLRNVRLRKGATLRQVAGRASVALGYLSEIERGQKEASSEILASVASALDTPLSQIYHEVGNRLLAHEEHELREQRLAGVIPDTVPDDLLRSHKEPVGAH